MKKLFVLFFVLLISITTVFAQEYRLVRAEHILVKTHSEALELEKRISNGESFEELAKEYSICPSSRRGGDLGYFRHGDMVSTFEEAAFNMAIGEISEPVKTQFGWHIISFHVRRVCTNYFIFLR